MMGAVLATLLFATSSVTAKQSVQRLGSSTANLLRLLLATTLLGFVAHGWGVGFRGPSLPWFLWSGLIGYGLCDTALFMALPRLGARLTSLMVQCLAAPIAAGTEWLWLGTHLGTWDAAASLTILLGVAIALMPSAPPANLPEASRTPRMGKTAFFLGFIAAAGQAVGAVLSRHGQILSVQAGFPIDPFSVSYQRIVAGAMFGLGWWWIRRRDTSGTPARGATEAASKSRLQLPTAFWVIMNGVSGPFLGVASYQWALKNTSTGVVLSITALTPLAVVPLAWWVDGERATPRSLIGGCIAVLGVLSLVLHR